jgi:hypothetical protein
MKLLKSTFTKALGIILLVYALLGFVILPKLAINKAKSIGEELLGSAIEIEKLSFNPFSFELTLNNVKISALESHQISTPTRFGLKQLHLNFEPHALFKKEIKLKSLNLEQVQLVFALLAEQKTNWEVKSNTNESSKKEASNETPWTLHFESLNIQNSEINFIDRSLREPLDLKIGPLNLGLQNFSTSIGSETSLKQLKFALANEGLLELTGKFSTKPIKAELVVKSRDLPLDFLSSFLLEQTYLEVKEGFADLDNTLIYKEGRVLVSGNSLIKNLNLQHQQTKKSPLSFKSLEISNLNFQTKPTIFNADKMQLNDPRIVLILKKDGKLNLSELKRIAGPKKDQNENLTAKKETETKDLPDKSTTHKQTDKPEWNIQEFSISNGRLDFNDQQIQPNFSALVSKLSGVISPIKSSVQKTNINLKGGVEAFGKFMAKGYVYTGAAQPQLNLNVNFSNIEMTTFTPYSGQFAGYEINKGKLFLNLNYTLNKNLIKGTNDVRLDQFTLGQAVESDKAPNLPLKLALALMKDREGQIKFNLPVEGDVKSPQFSFSGLVWTALKNMLINIVAAPFDFIKGLVGGEDLAFVDFTVGKADLSPEQKDKLIKLSSVLIDKPELKLEIKAQYNLLDEESLKFKTEAEYKKWTIARAENILKFLNEQQIAAERIFILASQKIENSDPLVKAVLSFKLD